MNHIRVVLMLVCSVPGWASAVTPTSFFFNDGVYPASVAPAHHGLPGLPVEWVALARAPGTNDVLGYVARSETVTCHVAASGVLTCSDGQEIASDGWTVQQIFQLLAEHYAVLHTPQRALHGLPVDAVGPLRVNETSTLTVETMELEFKKSTD